MKYKNMPSDQVSCTKRQLWYGTPLSLSDGIIFNAMKEIELTRGFKTQVDDEYYEYLNQWKWQVCITPCSNYATRGKWDGNRVMGIKMHRVILGLTDSKIQVDHIDGNGLNNQKSNIRICDQSGNMRNKQSCKNSMSKFVGINRQFGRNRRLYWRARIMVGDKRVHIGLFHTEEDAAIARDRFILDNNIEFARLNILKRP